VATKPEPVPPLETTPLKIGDTVRVTNKYAAFGCEPYAHQAMEILLQRHRQTDRPLVEFFEKRYATLERTCIKVKEGSVGMVKARPPRFDVDMVACISFSGAACTWLLRTDVKIVVEGEAGVP